MPGALIVPPALIKPVKVALEEAGWLERALRIQPVPSVDGSKSKAIPLTHDGTERVASALRAGEPGAAKEEAARETADPGAERNNLDSLKDAVLAKVLGWLRAGEASWLPVFRLPATAGVKRGWQSGWQTPDAGAQAACKDTGFDTDGGCGRDRDSGAPVFTYSELFAGIGGFRVALDSLGGRCVYSCDNDPWAVATYSQNFGGAQQASDLQFVDETTIPPHDLLTAGFPCQPFSTVGKRLGFQDRTKGHLFYDIVRVAAACKPRAMLLENVKGLLTMEGAMETIVDELDALGYVAHHSVLNTRAYAPQHRERLYIVAFRKDVAAARDDTGREFFWPALIDLGLTVGDILSEPDKVPPETLLDERKWAKIQASTYFQRHPEARLCPLTAVAQTLMANYKSGYLLYTQFVAVDDTTSCKEDRQEPKAAKTEVMTAAAAPRVRFWTPRECLRLQGFPESYQPGANIGRFYRQIGNAVSPPIVAAVCEQMLEYLGLASAVPSTDVRSPAFLLAQRAVPPRTSDTMASKLRRGLVL